MSTDAKEISHEIRAQILDAASNRFRQYGYNKTTMAEIAKDCDMSASNIYRFFENKLEIGASLATACLNGRVCNMQSEVDQSNLSCEQRFRNLIHRIYKDNLEQLALNARMNELVVAVCNDKKDIVKQHSANKLQIVEQLLEEAVQRGEFHCQEITRSAQAVLTATVLFDMPLLLSAYTEDELRIKAENLCDLLLEGLRSHI